MAGLQPTSGSGNGGYVPRDKADVVRRDGPEVPVQGESVGSAHVAEEVGYANQPGLRTSGNEQIQTAAHGEQPFAAEGLAGPGNPAVLRTFAVAGDSVVATPPFGTRSTVTVGDLALLA